MKRSNSEMAERARKKAGTARKKTVRARPKTAKKQAAKGPNARRHAAKKAATRRAAKKTVRQRPPHVGEEARIALRRERVLQATAGGVSMRQIAAELEVSVATIHEDVNAELLACRDRTRSHTENHRDLEMIRMDTVLRMSHPVLTGADYALRLKAGRLWVQTSVQRSRLLGLYQQEGATDTQPQDFLEFLDDFWERRRLGEGVPVIALVPDTTKVP